MTQDNLIRLSQPGAFSDLLTDVLRNGARALLAQAVEAEVAGFLGGHADKLTDVILLVRRQRRASSASCGRGAEGIVPRDSAADRGTTTTATNSACVRPRWSCVQ